MWAKCVFSALCWKNFEIFIQILQFDSCFSHGVSISGIASLFSCFSPSLSHCYQRRFCGGHLWKGLMVYFLEQSLIVYHSLQQKLRNLYWFCLWFLIWDLKGAPVWPWQITVLRRIPAFADGSIEIVVAKIYMQNLILALWCPCMSNWILFLVPKFEYQSHFKVC